MKIEVPSIRTLLSTLVSMLGLLPCIAAAHGTESSLDRPALKILADGGSIEVCQAGACKSLKGSGELAAAIDEGYSKLSILKLPADGSSMLIATVAGGSYCSKLFSYDGLATLNEIRPQRGRQLCNLTVVGEALTSSYLLDAVQRQDIYVLNGQGIELLMTDSCVSCGMVKREISEHGHVGQHLLMSDATDYRSRHALSSTVISDKAHLYEAPDAMSKSKMYLLRGYSVALLD